MSNDFVKLKHVGHYLWGIDTCRSNICRENALVGHYLWGIDTSTVAACACRLLPVGHYLWGIDTFRKLAIPFLILFVGHYLWGIDTKVKLYPSEWIGSVGHYLWGIDTASAFLQGFEQRFLNRRTLPMRNWHVYGIRTFQFVLSSGITFPTRIPCANT